jgi:hypothetical protein
MRQFIYLLLAAYVIVGIGSCLVYYQEREKHVGPKAARDQLAMDAAKAGLLWPFYIVDILSEHDARELS